MVEEFMILGNEFVAKKLCKSFGGDSFSDPSSAAQRTQPAVLQQILPGLQHQGAL
jgi:hypothetical protein